MQSIAFVVGLLFVLCFLLYRAALPKPIPGIPCDARSAGRLLGDVPDALQYHGRTLEMMTFLESRCKQLGSPIIQVFMRPFARPWVVLADAREAEDIMVRRNGEFDRSNFFGDLIASLFPKSQLAMPTNDHWRYNRRLVGDAMSPAFLNNVATKKVCESTIDLIDLWRQKVRIAGGHVLDVSNDLRYCTVDTIWAATFGESIGASRSQVEYLSRLAPMQSPRAETVIPIAVNGLSGTYKALEAIAHSSEIPMTSPLGRTHHWLAIKLYPIYRRAIALRDSLVKPRIHEAYRTFKDGHRAENDSNIRCVVDLVVQREVALARKEGRAPDIYSGILSDELNSFLSAGFETTATALGWGLKYLTKYQDVQQKLRLSLKAALEESADNSEQPAGEAIAKAHIPYLDAFIEEVLRFSSVVAANMRVATVDANVLGHIIPKGTDVFMLTTGPSLREPAMHIDEAKRSASSRASKSDVYDRSTEAGLSEFKPERWLRRDERNGEAEFDPLAAPSQTFGKGVRACFGKRLAYLEMRIIFCLILWNFELRPIPDALLDFRAHDVITHGPQNVRVALAEVEA